MSPRDERHDRRPTPYGEIEKRPVSSIIHSSVAEHKSGKTGGDIYRKVIFAVDRVALGEVLKAVGENQVEASRRLGISRTTLRAKLQNLNATNSTENQPPTPE